MHLLDWLNLANNIDGYGDDVNVSWILDGQDSYPVDSMQCKFNRMWSTSRKKKEKKKTDFNALY